MVRLKTDNKKKALGWAWIQANYKRDTIIDRIEVAQIEGRDTIYLEEKLEEMNNYLDVFQELKNRL
jgi:hypothetical protein